MLFRGAIPGRFQPDSPRAANIQRKNDTCAKKSQFFAPPPYVVEHIFRHRAFRERQALVCRPPITHLLPVAIKILYG